MSKRLENLNNIVGILNAGADFYRRAARQTGSRDVEAVFVEHAELREAVARDLSQTIDDAGAEPAAAAPSEQARAMASQVGTLFNDTDDVLVSSLEEHEDRTLAAFRQAINHKDNQRDEATLREYMAQFETSHDRMRTLKHSGDPKKAAEKL